jgi:putative phosphoribosyl transferase
VPVAAEVARALRVPLDVLVVRKLGVPGHEELAMGALASGGTRVMNAEVLETVRVGETAVERVVERESRELERRERAYRGDHGPEAVAGRNVLLVDDGLATGASMRAAVAGLKKMGPASVSVAIPVAAAETREELSREVDHLICLATPEPFVAVGLWYRDFRATSDEQVRDLLARGRSRKPSQAW